MLRTYTELSRLKTFEERFEYLSLPGKIGVSTFGFDRLLNQTFYRSKEWKRVRDKVIVRDHACDMGVRGFEIERGLLVHHINPISIEDIESRNLDILESEFLVCVSHNTHNAIHFGDGSRLVRLPPERKPHDTILWR